MTEINPMAVAGHNSEGAEPEDTAKKDIFAGIDSLYEEATHWADGTEIESQAQHDAVTAIRNALHELGKKADDMRVAEKEPHDKAAKAVQDEFNPYVQAKKGKVDRAKSCLDSVLAKWRVAEQKRKDEIARLEKQEADAELARATAAIRASSGNLLAREDAEEALKRAKQTQGFAKRAEREANTGTGLRTVRRIEFADKDDRAAGMDWAFEQEAERFFGLAVDMAAEYFRATKRCPPGFKVVEERAASGR